MQKTSHFSLLFKSALILTTLTLSFSASAQKFLSEGAFFARCYSQLIGEAAPLDHPLLIDSITKNDHQNSINNCMKVFDKARLIPKKFSPLQPGYPVGHAIADESDSEALKVLNYFFGVFQSYFEVKDFGHRPQTYSGVVNPNWDKSEDALFFIRSLFEGQAVDASGAYVSQVGVDQILTSQQSLTGKRLFPLKNNHAVGTCNSYGSNCDYSPTFVHRNLAPQSWRDLANWNWGNSMGTSGGMGPLTGVKVWPKGHNTYYTANGSPLSFSGMQRSHGGGAIGSTSHILKNAQYAGKTGGGVKNRRRIIKNAFSTFLCRDQPPLPMDDVVVLERVSDYLNQEFEKSHMIAFRESVLCASCHVTYDEAAAVFRNTEVTSGGNKEDWNSDGLTPGNYGSHSDKEKFGYDRMTLVKSQTVDFGIDVPEIHLVNGSGRGRPNTEEKANNVMYIHDYAKTEPKGRLVFSDYRGNKIDVDLPAKHPEVAQEDAGIQELGEAMANTDQFYACMTKRMFNHFTGIDLSLENPFDSRVQNRSQEDEYYLSNIIEPLALGSSGLQGHKSLRRTIKEIISSDIYRSVNMRGVSNGP